MNKPLRSVLSRLGSREVIPLCRDARACSTTRLMVGDLVWRDVPDSNNWAVRVAAVPLRLGSRADFFGSRRSADVQKWTAISRGAD